MEDEPITPLYDPMNHQDPLRIPAIAKAVAHEARVRSSRVISPGSVTQAAADALARNAERLQLQQQATAMLRNYADWRASTIEDWLKDTMAAIYGDQMPQEDEALAAKLQEDGYKIVFVTSCENPDKEFVALVKDGKVVTEIALAVPWNQEQSEDVAPPSQGSTGYQS